MNVRHDLKTVLFIWHEVTFCVEESEALVNCLTNCFSSLWDGLRSRRCFSFADDQCRAESKKACEEMDKFIIPLKALKEYGKTVFLLLHFWRDKERELTSKTCNLKNPFCSQSWVAIWSQIVPWRCYGSCAQHVNRKVRSGELLPQLCHSSENK